MYPPFLSTLPVGLVDAAQIVGAVGSVWAAWAAARAARDAKEISEATGEPYISARVDTLGVGYYALVLRNEGRSPALNVSWNIDNKGSKNLDSKSLYPKAQVVGDSWATSGLGGKVEIIVMWESKRKTYGYKSTLTYGPR